MSWMLDIFVIRVQVPRFCFFFFSFPTTFSLMFIMSHIYFIFEFTDTFFWPLHSSVESINWVLIFFSSKISSISISFLRLLIFHLFQVCSYLFIEAFLWWWLKSSSDNSNISVILCWHLLMIFLVNQFEIFLALGKTNNFFFLLQLEHLGYYETLDCL